MSSRSPHSELKGGSDQVCSSPLGFSDLTLDFPQPPTYIPAPFSDTLQSVQGDKIDIHIKNDSVLSHLHLRTAHKEISEISKENLLLHRSVDQPSSAVEPVRVFDRLKSLTKAFAVYSNVTSTIGKSPSFLARFTRAKHLRKPTSNGKTVVLPKPPGCVDVTPPSPVVEQASSRIKYERVDPSKLTASPSLLNLDILDSSARTSFVPPSPSWLSRNVPSFDPSELSDYLRTSGQLGEDSTKPSAPPQLFISHSRPHSLHLSPLEIAGDWLPNSDFPNYPYQVGVQFSPYNSKLDELKRLNSSNLALTATNSLVQLTTFNPKTTPIDCDIFIPPLYLSDRFGPDSILLPREFWETFNVICAETGVFLSEMDYTGKRTDVVDFGGETDYSHYQWFQDAPPRAPVSQAMDAFSSSYKPHI